MFVMFLNALCRHLKSRRFLLFEGKTLRLKPPPPAYRPAQIVDMPYESANKPSYTNRSPRPKKPQDTMGSHTQSSTRKTAAPSTHTSTDFGEPSTPVHTGRLHFLVPGCRPGPANPKLPRRVPFALPAAKAATEVG